MGKNILWVNHNTKEYKDNLVTNKEKPPVMEIWEVCLNLLGNIYGKAEEYQTKALAIRKEIGDREGATACYGNLGTVFHSLGEYPKVEEYLTNAAFGIQI